MHRLLYRITFSLLQVVSVTYFTLPVKIPCILQTNLQYDFTPCLVSNLSFTSLSQVSALNNRVTKDKLTMLIDNAAVLHDCSLQSASLQSHEMIESCLDNLPSHFTHYPPYPEDKNYRAKCHVNDF